MQRYKIVANKYDYLSKKEENKIRSLHKWNYYAFLMHAIWVLLIIIVTATIGAPYKISVQKMFKTVNTSFLPARLKTPFCNGTEYNDVFQWFDCINENNTETLDDVSPSFVVNPYVIVDVPVWLLLLLFELITTASHGILFLYREMYESFLKIQIQPFRWIEYSITCSLMTVTLMGLSNVVDIYLFLSMYTLSVFYNVYGGLFPEILNSIKDSNTFKPFSSFVQNIRLHALLASWFAFILSFVLIWDSFTASIRPYLLLENGDLWGQLFGFILILNIVLLVAFLSFPFIQLIQFTYAGDRMVYLNCELAYIFSSFIAKTILTLILMISAINRND